MYFSQSEGVGRSWAPPPPPGVDSPSKRSSQVLYHPTLLSTHSTLGQTGVWYSSNPLTKRARFESLYPQRPGEKDCSHYMLTRTCKFGDTCKFDHPSWVPEGGIPDWKEVPLISTNEPLPERPGDPDCPYFLKTQRCKYGSKCKFNHSRDKMASVGVESADSSVLPERPSEPTCAFYMKTGKCKFGGSCKFHHPKDILMTLAGQESGNGGQADSIVKNESTSGDSNMINTPYSVNQTLFHNSKGLPIRMGEVNCPFYMKTGSCKYGTSCRYNHPDRTAINAPAILASSSAYNLDIGIVNPTASIYQTIDTRLPQSMLGVGPKVYPQRPGQSECDYYMKTGECKFGERCKFHHPIDRSAPAATLTLAGLPRREGAGHCPYYMKTGTCKYGPTCKFDHPPPGEVMGIGSQGTSIFKGQEGNGGEAGNI